VKEKNVLLFKFRCNIFIGVIIIKEMQGSVASGTPCTLPLNSGKGVQMCTFTDGRVCDKNFYNIDVYYDAILEVDTYNK
jgi:hypothetical protein